MTVAGTENLEPEQELKPAPTGDSTANQSSPSANDQPATKFPASDRPETATEEGEAFRHLDPRYIIVERIAGAIFGLCVAAVAFLGFAIWLVASWPPGLEYWISLAGLVAALVILAWATYVLPAAEHRRAAWRLSESGLEIRRGIFWRREITVPRARVQHTDVRQGPLERQYGVAKLVVHTAGTVAASVELSGLSLPIAKWLRDELIGELRGNSDAV